MTAYNFTLTTQIGDQGNAYPVLTANAYPWMNVQIVPTPDTQREIILEALRRRGGWIATAQDRTDFVAIQAGGGHPDHPTVAITRENYNQVAQALRDCLQAAADFWAQSHPL